MRIPKQISRGVGEGKIGVAFAVEQDMLTDNINANCADDFAAGDFGDLKFGQTFFEIVRRKTHCFPDFFQRGQIVHGRAAHA